MQNQLWLPNAAPGVWLEAPAMDGCTAMTGNDDSNNLPWLLHLRRCRDVPPLLWGTLTVAAACWLTYCCCCCSCWVAVAWQYRCGTALNTAAPAD